MGFDPESRYIRCLIKLDEAGKFLVNAEQLTAPCRILARRTARPALEWSYRKERRILSIHRYPVPSLLSDSLRAVFGITVTLGPLFFLNVALAPALVLGGLGLIFLTFALRLVQQSLSSIELSSEGISRHGPVARKLAWPDVTSLKLAHYGAPRKPSGGWYQLMLRGSGGILRVDSTINDFEDIVASAVEAAKKGRLILDPATVENLKVLGHIASQQSVSE
ncbi:MAG: hypothetical protein ACR2RF_15065 [Geminicoccaceae bacterium]